MINKYVIINEKLITDFDFAIQKMDSDLGDEFKKIISDLSSKNTLLVSETDPNTIIKICDEILNQFPDTPRILIKKAENLYLTGNKIKALELQNKAFILSPQFVITKDTISEDDLLASMVRKRAGGSMFGTNDVPEKLQKTEDYLVDLVMSLKNQIPPDVNLQDYINSIIKSIKSHQILANFKMLIINH